MIKFPTEEDFKKVLIKEFGSIKNAYLADEDEINRVMMDYSLLFTSNMPIKEILNWYYDAPSRLKYAEIDLDEDYTKVPKDNLHLILQKGVYLYVLELFTNYARPF